MKILKNMDNQFLYIVTSYGCNSTPSDMWTPISNIFVNYEHAYAYFLKVAPDLDDEENKAEQYINIKYNAEDITKDYIVIENRVQIAGYGYEENRAKRPKGAVIARVVIRSVN
jgi:hypothetical protein